MNWITLTTDTARIEFRYEDDCLYLCEQHGRLEGTQFHATGPIREQRLVITPRMMHVLGRWLMEYAEEI